MESNESCRKKRNLLHSPGADCRRFGRLSREISCAKALTTPFFGLENKCLALIRVIGNSSKAARRCAGFRWEMVCVWTMSYLPDKRGLFLDLDGTLVDSLSGLRHAYFQFLR